MINSQVLIMRESFKKISSPLEAKQLLKQAIDAFHSVDKHLLQDLILSLRQNATDLKFKHYRARCQYILIPPEDSLTFWINYVLGHCPEGSRFSVFEGEVQELLKILDTSLIERNNSVDLPRQEISTAVRLIKDKCPGFLSGLTREPILIPVMNFSIKNGSVLSWPQLNCFALFVPKNEEVQSLISILHSLVHIIHYNLTEELEVLPLGFENLLRKLSEDQTGRQSISAETFAETITASLLYDTEYMSLVAYMEFDHQQQEEIHHYLTWLQRMFYSGLGDNVKKMMAEHQKKLRA